MKPVLIQAVELVRNGATYVEAADKLGISRNAVAGACLRSGLKVGRKGRRRGGVSSEKAIETWADPSIRAARMKAMRRAFRDPVIIKRRVNAIRKAWARRRRQTASASTL